MVVSTPSWHSISGKLQRFERSSTQLSWKAVGKPMLVVVGKQGLGWDVHFKNEQSQAAIKQEGDGLTPMGIYVIGSLFGFDEKSNHKMPYFPLKDTSVCVDDVKSTYYNQLIDSATVSQKDWHSGEQMRQIPQYKWGAVLQYNTTPTTPGAGSCIFLHSWTSPNSGTAGCIAMEESNLKTNLNWLDARKNPVIAIFSMQDYKYVKSKWKLPKWNNPSS